MISAHYKYDKQSAESFIASHIGDLPSAQGAKVTVEIIPDNFDATLPLVPPYSFSYPCPIRVLEKIASPNHEWLAGIKELRAITGWGLKESKDYVEYIARIIKQ